MNAHDFITSKMLKIEMYRGPNFPKINKHTCTTIRQARVVLSYSIASKKGVLSGWSFDYK